jgi:hypothetical protein
MALALAGGNSDLVSCGHASSIDTLSAATLLVWVNYTGSGAIKRGILAKEALAAANGWGFHTRAAGAGSLLLFVVRGTSNQTVIAANSTLGAGWTFLAAQWDITNGSPKIFKGDLSTSATDVSTSPTNGSGSQVSDTSTDLLIGNLGEAPSADSFPGRIACAAIVGRVLTLGEICDWQWRPRNITGCKAYWQLGHNGTSTQPDWSGNGNSGAVIGATQAAHVPLGPLVAFGEQPRCRVAARVTPLIDTYRRRRI